MSKRLLFLLLLLPLFSGCRKEEKSDHIVSMQVIDRNGFSETISTKERLVPYQTVNYLASQPYQKVLRVFGKDGEGKSRSKLTSYHGNGGAWQYLEAVDGRANGRYLEWHENGKLKIDATVIEGLADLGEQAQRSWLFDKECHVWDPQGNLEAEFLYDKGYLAGTARHYHPNGAVKSEISYAKGLAHGLMKSYDPEGNLLEEVRYQKGEKDGLAKGLWSHDTPKYEEVWHEGNLVQGSYHTPSQDLIAEIMNGSGRRAQFNETKLYSLTEYHEGIPEGEVEVFAPNETLAISFRIREGKKTGEEWEYYPAKSGEETLPKLMVSWYEDAIQGMCKTWYKNGNLESQREMSANKKHGLGFAYYETGDLMLMEEYESDKLKSGSYYRKGDSEPVSTIKEGEGIATLYNSQGQFLKKINYEHGKPIVD